MKAPPVWGGPVHGSHDTRLHLSTSPLPPLPEGRADTADTSPPPSSRDHRSLADSPRSLPAQRPTSSGDGNRIHSHKHRKRGSRPRSSPGPRHGKDARGGSSSLAGNQGAGKDEGGDHVPRNPSSVSLQDPSEPPAVAAEENQQRRASKQTQGGGQHSPGPHGDRQSDEQSLLDPRNGVVINITPPSTHSPTPGRRSSSSPASSPHSRSNRPVSARTSSRPPNRQEEEDEPRFSGRLGSPLFLRPHSGAGGSRPRSARSAIASRPSTSRPTSGRPHSHQGISSRPASSSRPESRHSCVGRGETPDTYSLALEIHKRTARRRPWTAPPKIRVRMKKDYLEKEEAYHNGLRDSSGGGGRGRQQELPDHHHPHFSEQAKQKHEEIIRQILDEFDLEETKEKYRNSNAHELRRKGTSLEDFKFRSELMRLMGSEVIRLNDSAWTTKFQQRLRVDYERRLDTKEQVLANREKVRVHQLRLDGITESGCVAKDKDLLENAFSVCYFRPCRSSMYPNARPRIDDRWPVVRKKTFKDETARIRESELSARSSARRYQPPAKTILEELYRTASEEDRLGQDVDPQEKESKGPGMAEIFPSAARHGESEMQTYSSTLVKREFSRTERRKNLLKRHPAHVIRLYEAESVSSLYNCAEQIVGSPRGSKNKETETATAAN